MEGSNEEVRTCGYQTQTKDQCKDAECKGGPFPTHRWGNLHALLMERQMGSQGEGTFAEG